MHLENYEPAEYKLSKSRVEKQKRNYQAILYPISTGR